MWRDGRDREGVTGSRTPRATSQMNCTTRALILARAPRARHTLAPPAHGQVAKRGRQTVGVHLGPHRPRCRAHALRF